MEPVLLWLLVAAVVLPIAYARARGHALRRLRSWRAALEACGASAIEEADNLEFADTARAVYGRRGALRIELATFKRGKNTAGTRIVVRPLDAVSRLRLRVEGFDTTIMKRLGVRELELGDTRFDDTFLIQGPAPLVFAVLDQETRRRVWFAMSGSAKVAGASPVAAADAELMDGALRVDLPERAGAGHQDLPGVLRTILDAAEALAGPIDVPQRLATNARQDPVAEVRLGNLKMLAREFPGHQLRGETLRRACADESDEVRLYAATALGEEGHGTLLQLAFGTAADSMAARAIAALGAQVPADRVRQALADALAAGRIETACASMDTLGLRSQEPDAARAEALFIDALSHASERVRMSAARALGSAGSVDAVLPLQEAAGRFGGDLRAAARQGVAQIQSRLAGATPGQISLAAAGTGELSLADRGGEVSLPGDDAAR